MKVIELNNDQIYTIANALRAASVRYEEHAGTCKEIGGEANTRLADQFLRQQKEATEFAFMFEGAVTVAVTI